MDLSSTVRRVVNMMTLAAANACSKSKV
jgi:hypothetical protein